ncbi:pollen receptor-like kinase 2 [Salvia miltiorrhiza]|uniref:pollen receptor-like kinase 2 n=1 Tax=Salvia miltiorrhiza TaxID=226208 RepID=UPI0025AD79EB|nr:pollen receptor-like kinase 2 [Salvia miltiorrhiza]
MDNEVGNEALCGASLDQACPSNGNDNGVSHHRRFPETTIAVVAILLGATLIAFIGVCIFFVCHKKRSQQGGAGAASASAAATPAATADVNEMERGAGAAAAGGSESGKPSVRLLTFLKEDSEKFDMQELLKASGPCRWRYSMPHATPRAMPDLISQFNGVRPPPLFPDQQPPRICYHQY